MRRFPARCRAPASSGVRRASAAAVSMRLIGAPTRRYSTSRTMSSAEATPAAAAAVACPETAARMDAAVSDESENARDDHPPVGYPVHVAHHGGGGDVGDPGQGRALHEA